MSKDMTKYRSQETVLKSVLSNWLEWTGPLHVTSNANVAIVVWGQYKYSIC